MNVTFETKNKTFAGKHEWYSPKNIITDLNKVGFNFITDPCAAPEELRPFNIGKQYNYTQTDDGLNKQWFGCTFVNPPYGNNTKQWLKKSIQHNDCLVLIFARTETKMFFDYVWNKASGIMFFKGRIQFIDSENKTQGNAGAPSVLIAYGEENAMKLEQFSLLGYGKFLYL